MCVCVCVCVCVCEYVSLIQEIDELLGQNLTQEDEDAIAEELESIILVCPHKHTLTPTQPPSRTHTLHRPAYQKQVLSH